ncbi:MAG: hypothetical protein R8G66_02295 [Cytophagales bacterium]|nr:hypothetical protein [Cytophagales bacterium]
MRLSLLARKLSVKPSVIINELLVEGEKPLHGNSKLSEEQIDEIIKLFGPLPEEVEEPEPVEAIAEKDAVEKASPSEPIEAVETVVTESATDVSEEITQTENEPLAIEESQDAVLETAENEEEIAISVEVAEAEEEPTIIDQAEEHQESEEVTEQEEAVEEANEVEEMVSLETSDNGHTEGLVDVDNEASEKTEKREVLVSDLLEDPDEELLENTDVLIKAPKVHLPGLTVKGKIDLPEPKPKQEKEATEKDEDTEGDFRGRRGRHRGKRRKQTNPVAAARIREERKAERQKKAQQLQEKDRKRKHYQQNIQSKAAPPPKKKPTKKVPGHEQVKPTQGAPTKMNALQRFWKWMNT